jgi:hypothetical protein
VKIVSRYASEVPSKALGDNEVINSAFEFQTGPPCENTLIKIAIAKRLTDSLVSRKAAFCTATSNVREVF